MLKLWHLIFFKVNTTIAFPSQKQQKQKERRKTRTKHVSNIPKKRSSKAFKTFLQSLYKNIY